MLKEGEILLFLGGDQLIRGWRGAAGNVFLNLSYGDIDGDVDAAISDAASCLRIDKKVLWERLKSGEEIKFPSG